MLPDTSLRCLSATPSTQDEARALVRAGDRAICGVRAGYQSSGRGRRGASWIAPPDTCLLVTYILYGDDCRPDVAHRLAFVAALAVAEPLAALNPSFKWPNDVRLDGRKVAGILIETATAPDGEPAALVGIGLNANVADFPPELAASATSLMLESGREWPVEALEREVRAALWTERELLHREGFAAVLERWRARDATAGMRFRVEDGTEGVAVGVADTGALLLRADDGETRAVLGATHVTDDI